ncbi:MAG: mannose-1-phosphate guanylyltransferase [Candidatus Xenobia bacterium]
MTSRPVVPVVMAGGAGVRFWPLSTEALPKQFITTLTDRSLYQMTVERALALAPAEQILVMTNAALVSVVRDQSPELPSANAILEPCRRDTAPAMALAAAIAERRFPGCLMVVMPSDHLIRPAHAFQETIQLALQRAGEGGLGTIGIPPTHPATAYGYLLTEGETRLRRVQRFVEKPERARAEGFVADPAYLWNGGIFIWQAAGFLEQLRSLLPETAALMERVAAAWGTADFEVEKARAFDAVKPISVDFGVMEKAPEVWTVSASFDWSDVGGWRAACDLLEADEQGNRLRGAVVLEDCRNTFALSADPQHPILCVGMRDVLVVSTPAGTLVCPQSRADDLKPLVERILAAQQAARS